MQYMFRSICLTIGLFIAALPAQAFDFKPYAGVGLGEVIVDAGLGGKTAFAGYGILGADLHENYGVEIRFGSTSRTTGSVVVPQGFQNAVLSPAPIPANISVDWFVSYLLKLQYPIDDQFRIYGLVGGTTLKSRFAFTAPIPPLTIVETVHKTNTTLSYGGGIDYNLGNQWLVGVDAMIYSNKATTTQNASFSGLDVWGITATIKREF